MKATHLILLLGAATVAVGGRSHAQEIARTEYLKYMPLGDPHLIQQTSASEALHLFGNREGPNYRDVNPVDGIDDDRHDLLLALAVRFAPYLVQNTSNIPTNFDRFIDNADSFPLFVDTWDVSGEEPRLTQTQGINFSVLGQEDCTMSRASQSLDLPAQSTMQSDVEDCKLMQVLERLSPLAEGNETAGKPFVRERLDVHTVLFFNFPGDGPDSWAQAYAPEYAKTPEGKRNSFPHSYVHPFLASVHDTTGALLGYDLVLQYWFYYPSNDGGNNHEGDWEHLNVVVAPKSLVERPLSADTVQEILGGRFPLGNEAVDPLVIRRAEYYFHHYVMTLDFSNPNVYVPREQWKREINRRVSERFQEREIWHAIRHLAYVDKEETVINTHPLGYIGADNKGFDQALAKPGGKNRDSHGTFPFPGRYHNIGPAGATEQISLYVDPRQHWKKLQNSKRSRLPVFKRGQVLGLADPERLRIVPDWERIVDDVRTDARARRDWSWLILPIRWGYPATVSPLAGLLPHADTGNLAPNGPSFSSGWNVTGPAPGFRAYEPHILPSVFPLRLQDGFRNDLGFFNLTFPVLFNLPPLDFLTRLGTYPVKLAFSRRDPVYYPKEQVPYRFVGLSTGISIQTMDENFNVMALNPEQYDEFIGRLLVHLLTGSDSTTVATKATESRDKPISMFFQVPFYIGEKFVSENTVRNIHANFGIHLEFNNIPPYAYDAEINYWEYAGSLRYNLSASRIQPFVKGGYGWSWYRLENVRANGVPFEPAESQWIKPRIWPNVWHLGAGLEFVPWKNVGTFPRGTEVAFRFEYTRYFESLGLDLSSISLQRLSLAFPTLGDVPNKERLARNDFLFGLTISF